MHISSGSAYALIPLVTLVLVVVAFRRKGLGAAMTMFAQSSTGPAHATSWMFPGRESGTGPGGHEATEVALVDPRAAKELPDGVVRSSPESSKSSQE